MMNNIIWEDMKFFLTRLKSLSVSESMTLGNKGGFCVSTNCSDESWVYYPERITDRKTVDGAIKFFADRNIAFLWPVYDGGEEILKDAGLIHAGDMAAMTIDPADIPTYTDPHIKFEHVITPEQSRNWAQTAWRAFFGGNADETPENYFAFIDALANDRENLSLYLARRNGECAGTILLTNEEAITGAYDLGVVPEMRRHGVARAIISEVSRLSEGKRFVFQANPSSRQFHNKFGVDELFMIPVYSTKLDIF